MTYCAASLSSTQPGVLSVLQSPLDLFTTYLYSPGDIEVNGQESSFNFPVTIMPT
jgi:hypothetical protein